MPDQVTFKLKAEVADFVASMRTSKLEIAGLTGEFQNLRGAAADVSRALQGTANSYKSEANAAKESASATKSAGEAARTSTAHWQRLNSAMAGMRQTGRQLLTVFGGVGLAIAAVSKSGVEFNQIMSRATTTLTQITRSPEAAKSLFSDLSKEELKSALTLEQITEQGTALAAVFGPAGLGKILPTIRAFSDAMVASGKGPESAVRALQNFKTLIQLGPRLQSITGISKNLPAVNSIKILTDAFGTADSKILKAAGVTGQQVGDALIAGIEKSYGGLEEKLAAKDPGIVLSNLKGVFQRLAGSLTSDFTPTFVKAISTVQQSLEGLFNDQKSLNTLKSVFDGLGSVVQRTAEAIKSFIEWFRKLDPATQQLIVKGTAASVALTGISGATLLVAGAFGGAIANIGRVVGLLGGAAGIFSGAGAALAGMVPLIAGVAAGAVALGVAWKVNIGGIRDFTKNFVQETGQDFSSFATHAGEEFRGILSELNKTASFYAPAIQPALNALKFVWDGAWAAIKDTATVAWGLLRTGADAGITAISVSIKDGLKLMRGDWKGVTIDISKEWSSFWHRAEDRAKVAWQHIKEYSKGFLQTANDTLVNAGTRLIGGALPPAVPSIPSMGALQESERYAGIPPLTKAQIGSLPLPGGMTRSGYQPFPVDTGHGSALTDAQRQSIQNSLNVPAEAARRKAEAARIKAIRVAEQRRAFDAEMKRKGLDDSSLDSQQILALQKRRDAADADIGKAKTLFKGSDLEARIHQIRVDRDKELDRISAEFQQKRLDRETEFSDRIEKFEKDRVGLGKEVSDALKEQDKQRYDFLQSKENLYLTQQQNSAAKQIQILRRQNDLSEEEVKKTNGPDAESAKRRVELLTEIAERTNQINQIQQQGQDQLDAFIQTTKDHVQELTDAISDSADRMREIQQEVDAQRDALTREVQIAGLPSDKQDLRRLLDEATDYLGKGVPQGDITNYTNQALRQSMGLPLDDEEIEKGKTRWQSFMENIRQITDRSFRGLGESFFENLLSGGKRAKNAFSQLGQDIKSLLIRGAAASLTEGISETFSGLFGGGKKKNPKDPNEATASVMQEGTNKLAGAFQGLVGLLSVSQGWLGTALSGLASLISSLGSGGKKKGGLFGGIIGAVVGFITGGPVGAVKGAVAGATGISLPFGGGGGSHGGGNVGISGGTGNIDTEASGHSAFRRAIDAPSLPRYAPIAAPAGYRQSSGNGNGQILIVNQNIDRVESHVDLKRSYEDLGWQFRQSMRTR